MTLGAMATSNRTRWPRQERPHPDSAPWDSLVECQGVSGAGSSLLTKSSGATSLGAAANWKEKICGLVVVAKAKARGPSPGPLGTQWSQLSFLVTSSRISTQILGLPAAGISPPTTTCLARACAPFPTDTSCFSLPQESRPRQGLSFIYLGFPGQEPQALTLPWVTAWPLQHACPCRVGGCWKGACRTPWTQPSF